ncbi:hypothetical protein SK128_018771, partial [Halocaridina rubra]
VLLPTSIFLGDHASVALEPAITDPTTAATIPHVVAICGVPTADASAWDSSSNGENKRALNFRPLPESHLPLGKLRRPCCTVIHVCRLCPSEHINSQVYSLLHMSQNISGHPPTTLYFILFFTWLFYCNCIIYDPPSGSSKSSV